MTKSKAEVALGELEIGTSEFAQLVGKSPRWIRQLTQDGVLAQCKRGKYKLSESLLAYIEYASGGKTDDEKKTHADVKTEHEVLKKEKTELQLQQMRGQLHSAEAVRMVMGDMILSAKAKLMSIPTRVSPMLDGEPAKSIEQILVKEISDALSVLVDYSPKMFTDIEIEEDESVESEESSDSID